MRSTLMQVVPIFVTLIILLTMLRRGKIDAHKIGVVRPARGFAWHIVFFVVFALSWDTWMYLGGHLDKEVHPWHYSLPATVIRVIGIIIVTPITEEIIFRGMIFSALRRRFPTFGALLLQAAVFTGFHAIALWQSQTVLLDLTQLFLDSLLFGYAREETKSLYPSMAMHAFSNALAVVERVFGV